MIYLFLDCLVYNYTAYTSFFFLESLNKKGIIYIIALAFLIDFIVLKTWYIHLVLLPLFYLLKKYVLTFDYRKFIYFWGVNLLFVLLYYFITTFIYSSFDINIFINMFIVNALFYAICYIKDKDDIKLCRVK